MKRLYAAAAAAVMFAVPVAAHAELDFASIATQGPPPEGSPGAAELCAAVSLYFEFNTDNDADRTRYDAAAHRWAGLASGLKGDDLEDYMDETVMDDAAGFNGFVQGDQGTLDYYRDYCDKAAAHRQ